MLRDKVEKSNESICQKRDLFLLVGGLIMACAIAAFLKIQVQLFLMRRRELVLRMVYGATFRRLYTMFAWEIGLTMTLAGILACALTAWVSAIFRDSTLMAKSYPWQIEGVYPDLFITLATVFLLCVAVCGLGRKCSGAQRDVGRKRHHQPVFPLLGGLFCLFHRRRQKKTQSSAK